MCHHCTYERDVIHLDDALIRATLQQPKSGPEAIAQARYAALAVEQDRQESAA